MTETATQHAHESRVQPIWRRAGVAAAGLIVVLAIGAMLANIVIARIPQQRATIERALRAHTGLDVRFARMYVGWGFRGAQAELIDVRITDPQAKRFHAAAPRVRASLDTWGLFRGGEFSLGRVTLVQPSIEIDLSKIDGIGAATPSREKRGVASQIVQSSFERAALDGIARVLRALPAGRVELEAAALRLTGAREFADQSLQITRAVLRRDADSASAYATFLLPSELGKTVFVSVDARGLFTRGAMFDADARVITRQLQLAGVAPNRRVDGSATLDARAHVVGGVLVDANWQVNLRRMAMFDRAVDGVPLRFARADFNGKLLREADRWRLDIGDFHVAPAEGAGRSASFTIDAQADGRQGTLTSGELPLPVMQFLLALGSQAEQFVWPRELVADSGKLRDARFEWRARDHALLEMQLDAIVEQAVVSVTDANLRLEGVRGRVHGGARDWRFVFAPDAPVRVVRNKRGASVATARIEGAIEIEQLGRGVAVRAERVRVASDKLQLALSGHIESQRAGAVDLVAELAHWDIVAAKQYLHELAPQSGWGEAFAPLTAGHIETARIAVNGVRGTDGALLGDHASLTASAQLRGTRWLLRGSREPLVDADVVIRHEQGTTQATLAGGRIADIDIVAANATIAPAEAVQVRATALAALESASLRRLMPELARLDASGDVLLELQATVPTNANAPISWRGAARLSDAHFVVARGAPPVGRVRGAVSFADGIARRSTLTGRWLGGDVRMAVSDRPRNGAQRLSLRGVASAEALGEWLGIDRSSALAGDVAWLGTVDWDRKKSQGTVVIESALTGLSSSLPEPFAKRASRALPMVARIQFDANGVHDFELLANRKSIVRGSSDEREFDAAFSIADLRGTVRGAPGRDAWQASLESLRIDQSSQWLAVVNAIARTPTSASIELLAEEVRDSRDAYGPMTAHFVQSAEGFVLERIAAPSLYRGDDVRLVCRESCELSWRFASTGRDRMLELLGASPALAADDWRSSGSLSWPAALMPDVQQMSGQAELELAGGNWQSLPRTRSAGLVDAALAPVAALRPDGAAIDRWRASFVFEPGTVRVAQWRMNLHDGDLAARGQWRTADRRHELELEWHADTALPSSVADLTSRPRLAAAWAALRSRLSDASPPSVVSGSSQVRLGGTWSAPELIASGSTAQD